MEARSGAELLGMKAQRVVDIPAKLLDKLSHYDRAFVWIFPCLEGDFLRGLSSAILISGTQTYLSLKFVTFEIPYIIQHQATGAGGSLTPEPLLPGWKNTNTPNPGLLIQRTPQINLLDPKERLEAAQSVAAIVEYLECEGPLLKGFPWRGGYGFGGLVLLLRSASFIGTLVVPTCHRTRIWLVKVVKLL